MLTLKDRASSTHNLCIHLLIEFCERDIIYDVLVDPCCHHFRNQVIARSRLAHERKCLGRRSSFKENCFD